MLEEWAISLERIAGSIAKFNEEIEETILACCDAENVEDYNKERLNLEKYVKLLEQGLSNVMQFEEGKFQEMRDRTEAYFKKYVEVKDGEWTIVIPAE